jgi:methionine-S-sulfoxide reductase
MNRVGFCPDKPGRWRVLLAAFALALLPAPIMNAQVQSNNAPAKMETATIGGGCFWCAEAVFQRIPGVKSVTSGFAGGTVPKPSYEQVCTGKTGHAEVIQLTFDPAVLSYDKLLEIFWEAHDPTTLNRQGNDEGTQYRSIILYATTRRRRRPRSPRPGRQTVQEPDRHGDRAAQGVLSSGGLSPGLLQFEQEQE